MTGSDRERDVRLAAVVTHTRTSTDNGPDYCAECSEAISEWVKWPCPRSGREARKFGADTPHEPTDEFVVQAFAEGARYLWPDSRDPGWHVTFRRWLAAHDKAIAARALRSLRDHCDVRAGAPVAPGCPAAGDRQFWIRMAAAIDDYLNGSENA